MSCSVSVIASSSGSRAPLRSWGSRSPKRAKLTKCLPAKLSLGSLIGQLRARPAMERCLAMWYATASKAVRSALEPWESLKAVTELLASKVFSCCCIMAWVMDPCTRVFLYLRSSVCAKAPSVRSEAEAGKRAERGSGQVAGSGAWSSLTTSACAAAAEGARLILRSK